MRNWLKQIFSGTPQAAPHSPSISGLSPAEERAAQVRHWVSEGFTHLQAGNLEAARATFAKVLHEQPDHADALYLSGVIASNDGRNQEASELILRAIASDKSIAAFHVTLANVFIALGRENEALASYERALALEPDNAQALSEQAYTLHKVGRSEEALAPLRRALNLEPTAVQMQYNLATICQFLGRLDEAAEVYRATLALDPAFADAGNNLGAILHAQGRLEEAIACFKQTLERRPDHALAWNNLGCALQASRKVDEAEACLLRSIALNPQDFSAHSNLALAQREQGNLDASLASSMRALAIHDSLSERIRLATLLPVVARSADEIRKWRKHFADEVSKLCTQGGALDDPLREVGACNFNLAYQPECNRELQQKAAQLYAIVCPALLYTAPHCLRPRPADGRIKVGFISKFMYEHSIGRTTRGLLANLSPDRFEVSALFIPPLVDDDISRFIRDRADNYLVLPNTLEAAREKIAELELDILFYQDIGMDAYSYYLAYSRLAPVQCVSFGHPDTTGIANLDYWVSSENFEPEGAAEHYSEQLYLLRNVAHLAYYYRPTLAQPAKSRADFGLAEDRRIYLCPQSLFKVHPDFDAMLAEILRGDPFGEIVLIEARTASWGNILRERLQHAMPDVIARVRFLPGMSPDDFLALIAVSDVMLDTIYFNGMNTCLEAFSVGVAVVTMPTGLQRGRHAYGMYKRMGIDECIAATPKHYVDIVLRLGTDRHFRASVKEKILARNAVLYEDMNVVREFERFFIEAHMRAAQPN